MTRALFKQIADAFSYGELKSLCADRLFIDYEELAGETKTAKALELQNKMRRDRRTHELIQALHEQKPQLDLTPYLSHVVAEAFPSAEEMIALIEKYGFQTRNFGGPERFPWGNPFWLEDKARKLQERLEAEGRICGLLQDVKERVPTIDLTFYDADCGAELTGPALPHGITINGSKPAELEDAVEADTLEQRDSYDNFDLSIHRQNGGFLIEAECPYGEESETVQFDLADEELVGLQTYLRNLVARPDDARRLGDLLHGFLFPARIWTLYDRSLHQALDAGKSGLRIRLRFRLEQSDLIQIPWEYCRDDRDYFALNGATPVVRYLKTNRAPRPIATPDPVRILVAIASPQDLESLDVEAEATRIEAALEQLRQDGRVELKVLRNATKRQLLTELTTQRGLRPHVLHFIGHGTVLEDGQGALMLENDAGKADPADAGTVMRWLQDPASEVRVAVLNACLTAAYRSHEAIMGIAPRLVWAGLPAVIASQYSIPDRVATVFAEDLYTFLADGDPLDLAITRARRFASTESEVFWAIPVLFMRAPDGVIWQ